MSALVARAAAKIPLDASFYSFCYPYEFQRTLKNGEVTGPVIDPEKLESEHKIKVKDPFVSWLLYGGFVYFSYTYDILAINAFVHDQEQVCFLCVCDFGTVCLVVVRLRYIYSVLQSVHLFMTMSRGPSACCVCVFHFKMNLSTYARCRPDLCLATYRAHRMEEVSL